MANNKSFCRKTRHRCYSDKRCYRKSAWKRTNKIKRCRTGTRKCRDNKCHVKKKMKMKYMSNY